MIESTAPTPDDGPGPSNGNVATRGSAPSSGSFVATYGVVGMTCGHCVDAVSTEIGKLAGVTDVVVDLAEGRVTVTSGSPIADGDIAAAVDEAGYALVEPGVGTS